MKHLTTLLLIVFFVNTCNTPPKGSAVVNKTPIKEDFPFLIEKPSMTLKKNKEKKRRANYQPLYFGELKDTLLVNYLLLKPPVPPPPPPSSSEYFVNQEDNEKRKKREQATEIRMEEYSAIIPYFPLEYVEGKWKEGKEETVNIQVNTQRLIGNGFYDNNDLYEAYPVLLKNPGPDTLCIGYGEQLSLYMEAQDENGDWKAIEKPYIYACGVGLNFIVLPPNEVALTSAIKWDKEEANFETNLRIVLGKNHSNTFKGKIKKRYFK